MALSLYYKNDQDQFVEVTDTTPITTIHNGRTGDKKTIQLFIRNDDETRWFSNIIVKPENVTYEITGWGVKLYPGDSCPSVSLWEDITWGSQIDIEDIGSDEAADTSLYSSFWYYITCPPNEPVIIKKDISLKVSFTENIVA
jgi:hypothetical protein